MEYYQYRGLESRFSDQLHKLQFQKNMCQGKLDKSNRIINNFNSNQNSNQKLFDPIEFISRFFDSLSGLSPIFKQLVLNTIRAELHYVNNYSDEMYNFSYALYCQSGGAYRMMTDHFRMPCKTSLNLYFGNHIDNLQLDFTHIDSVYRILERKGKNINEPIPCTLVVDAFSVTTISPFNQVKYLDREKSNCFLYLIAPFDPNFEIFPIYLYKDKNGNANNITIEYIKKILSISKETKFHIKYISVDGDKGYNNQFNMSFNQIEQSLFQSNFDNPFLDDFEKDRYILTNTFHNVEISDFFFISDFLHLLKNARSKLLKSSVVINPTTTEDFIDYIKLIQDRQIYNYVNDTSSFSKMKDELAIGLFNFSMLFHIYDNSDHGRTTFVYFLIYSLWTESILNRSFSNETRCYFLNIVLHFFKKIKQFYKVLKFADNVHEKNSSLKNLYRVQSFVTFVPYEKLNRIINTLIALLKEIHESQDIISLDRLGSHDIENYIGRIRSLCNSDNRFERVVRALARYEYIAHLSDYNFMHHKDDKKENIGGCRLRFDEHAATFNIIVPAEIIAFEILVYIGLEESSNDQILTDFLFTLQDFSLENEFQPPRIPYSLRGVNIVNRYYFNNKDPSNSFLNPKYSINVDEFIISHKEEGALNYLMGLGFSNNKSITILEQRKSYIFNSNIFYQNEDFIIQCFIHKAISLRDLKSALKHKRDDLITSRIQFLNSYPSFWSACPRDYFLNIIKQNGYKFD